MRRHFLTAITVVLVFGLMQSVSFADSKAQKKTFGEKLFKKVTMIYIYQDELDVSDKQIDQIKELKVDLKKELIGKKADMDLIKVDIFSLLYEEENDVEAIGKLIDQKYDIKKSKMKDIVKAYAKLKEILSKKQIEKFREIVLDIKKKHISRGTKRKW